MEKLEAVFFDFDSTVITKESFDEIILHRLSSHENKEKLKKQIELITNQGMEGSIPFTESLRQRFEVVPLTKNDFTDMGNELTKYITEGFRELFKYLKDINIKIYIVSGGFEDSVLPTAKLLGVTPDNVFCNTCNYDSLGNALEIEKDNPCYTNDGKAPVITHIKKIHNLTESTCMIGDGSNDLNAYASNTVEYFCGFTGNVARKIIIDNAPNTAQTASELKSFISEHVGV